VITGDILREALAAADTVVIVSIEGMLSTAPVRAEVDVAVAGLLTLMEPLMIAFVA